MYATLILHHSRVVARFIPAPSHHHLTSREHGTKVNVQNLFGNMPVRVKHRAIVFDDVREEDKHWNSLMRCIIGVLLAWDVPVKLSLRNSANDKHVCLRGKVVMRMAESEQVLSTKSFDLPLICSMLSQAGYIEYSDQETWIKTSARTLGVTIQGALSIQPAPSKNTQFISLGVQYISSDEGGNILYNEVNRIFAASKFGQQEGLSDVEDGIKERRMKDRRFKHNGLTQRQLMGCGKGVDRWPMFVIRIKLHNDEGHATHHDFERLEKENTITTIIEVLGTMVTSFLEEHHFRPRIRGPRKRQWSTGETCPGTKPLESTSAPMFIKTPVTASKPKSVSATRHKRKDVNSKDQGRALSANVTFPGPTRDQIMGFGDAFSGWRRIKSGNRGTDHEDFYRNPCNREFCSPLEQYSESSRHRIHVSHNADSQITIEEGSTLVQGSDTMGADFDILANSLLEGNDSDNLTSIVSNEQPKLQESKPDQSTACNPVDDEPIVPWTNPTSKTTFLVSSRTGHVKPISNSKHAKTTDERLPHSPPVSDTDSKTGPKPYFSATRRKTNSEAGTWVHNLLEKWENPVFRRQEESIAQISLDGPAGGSSNVLHGRQNRCSDSDINQAFKDASSSFATKFSKKGLSNADIISQVDKKFILVKIIEDSVTTAEIASQRNEILVLIDQHAADERIRVEGLLRDLCTQSIIIPPFQPSLGYEPSITATVLKKPMSYQIQPREISLFERCASYFAYWGILYKVDLASSVVNVQALPPSIAERCRADPKLLIEFLRGEIWERDDLGLTFHPSANTNKLNNEDWRTRIGNCPQGLLDMLNSRACRSAIMFNDELGLEECKVLVKRLAECSFPFVCAHGRPSMIPLVDLGKLRVGQ